jgi:hypothetical protein
MCVEVAGEDLRDGMSFELEGREERIALYEPMRQYRSTEYEGKEEGVKL